MGFCAYCGTKLENGAICGCQAAPPPPPMGAAPPPPMGVAPPPPPMGAAPPPPMGVAPPPPPMGAAPPPPMGMPQQYGQSQIALQPQVAPPPPMGAAPPPPMGMPPQYPQQNIAPPPPMGAAPPPPMGMPQQYAQPQVAPPPPMGVSPQFAQPQYAQPQVAPPPQATPPPVYAGTCLHCGYFIGDGVMWCGKCGKQAGTAPPPKPRRFCQGCGGEVSDGLVFCVICGHKVPGAGFPGLRSTPGGGAAPVAGNLNLGAAGGFIGSITAQLGISFQRLAIAATALLGFLFGFIPRYSLTDSGKFFVSMSGSSFPTPSYTILGIIAQVAFAAVAAVCMLVGNRAGSIGKLKAVVMGCAIVNILVGLLQLIAYRSSDSDYAMMVERGMGKHGFGLFPLLFFALVLVVLPFIKQLEND